MPKVKINERTVQNLNLEIDNQKKAKQAALRDNDALRQENSMLKEILRDITSQDDCWTDTVETRTLLWRLKNLLNNIN